MIGLFRKAIGAAALCNVLASAAYSLPKEQLTCTTESNFVINSKSSSQPILTLAGSKPFDIRQNENVNYATIFSEDLNGSEAPLVVSYGRSNKGGQIEILGFNNYFYTVLVPVTPRKNNPIVEISDRQKAYTYYVGMLTTSSFNNGNHGVKINCIFRQTTP